MKKTTQLLLLTVTMLFSATIFAQTISGTIVEVGSSVPLPGANVIEKGTSNGVTTDFDGNFTLNTSSSSGEIEISFVGYNTKTITFSGSADLGVIELESSQVGLEEVLIMASVAVDRKTPVAVSTIKSADIELKLGNQEFPEVLRSTPGIYATKQGGGYGDARVNIRGFQSENVAVMINGIPVNDMENGRVFWSNWAGLGDVTSQMQVQRGLGASKIAVPSIGGTINVVTKTTDVEQGGNLITSIANDGYFKYGMTYSTGLLDNGFAATISAAKTEGDGYVDGTEFTGFNYFINISKKINDAHKIAFSAFGAKQRHGQRQNRQLIETFKNSDRGRKFNADWGYKQGQLTFQEDNFYHKPQISLNHYWTLSENTSLNTSAYVSFGSGGGGGIRGTNKFGLGANGVSPYRSGLYGPINFDIIAAENEALGANGSETILRASRNDHNWYGVLSTLKTHLSDDLVLLTGLDFRSYTGIHFQEVTDLLGGQYWLDDSDENNPNNLTRVGDKINYHNDGKVGWIGAFGQLEYDVNEKLNTYLALAASNTSYKRIDYFNYLDTDPIQETDTYNFFGFSVKGGGNYRIDSNHNVFANVGYFERAADFDAVFLNFSNDNINADAENEKITSFELGYGYRSERLSANVNLYRTSWNDRTETASFQQPDGTRATANILGVNAIHQGIEIDFNYKATERINITGMLSLGDWTWDNNVANVRIFNEEQEEIDDSPFNLHIAGLKVGDAAQTTAALGLNYSISDETRLILDYNYFADNYADFDPSDRGVSGATPEEIAAELATDPVQPWKLPDFGIFDAVLKHDFKLGPFDTTLTGRVNNVFDTEYISDAQDGAGSTAQTALVYYGFGRTFSVGVKLNF
ncbi:TonB-dependent receptor [Seonamhaeicola marinus]|uniref:TonB-dependent receptor plug domain-containing protein n=1 Tax=Seonamhaeicola marinus TaxID=1912246 RepID=A0A5D0HGU4_9FLAO|nr:TonB-dependent receptor [Seonamhaeicola marinus]TYA70160.1 TonB-dependent receptor plug domain-containing protein [Seonamhaeicola marinus]